MSSTDPREVSPDRTAVFAVGIEKYGYDAIKLPGAADYAIRLAKWAAECGVPEDQIWLGCTYADEPTAAAPSGVNCFTPTRDNLDDTLRQVAALDADLLIFYWCGHGLLSENIQRVLFTSNYTSANRAHIQVDDIRHLLSSASVRALHHQILLLDSCANYLDDMRFDSSLGNLTLARANGASRTVEQFAIYSAEQGETAAFNNRTRTAAFSEVALPWLEDNASSWPVQPSSMQEALAEHFKTLFDSGTWGGARPAALHIMPPHGTWVNRGELPVSGESHAAAMNLQLTVPQMRDLVEALLGCLRFMKHERVRRLFPGIGILLPVNSSDWLKREVEARVRAEGAETLLRALEEEGEEGLESIALVRTLLEQQRWIAPLLGRPPWNEVPLPLLRTAYSKAIPAATRRVVWDVATAVDHAAEYGRRGHPDAPLYKLVAMLEQQTRTRVEDAWFELDVQQLSGLRRRAAELLDGSREPARLVVDLGGARAGTEWPDVVSWQLFDAGRWSVRHEVKCTATEEGVREAVQEAVDRASLQIADFHIGLVAPRAIQDAVPEAWPIRHPWYGPEPLGGRYPVVLHSAERFDHPQIHTQWRARLTKVQTRLQGETDVGWIGVSTPPDLRAMRSSVQDSESAVIGLEFVPGPTPLQRKDDPLLTPIAVGAPYVLWLGQEPDEWASRKTDVEFLVNDGAFGELPHRLFKQRRDDPDSIRTGPRLIWDDDGMPPVGQMHGGQAVREAGQPSTPVAEGS